MYSSKKVNSTLAHAMALLLATAAGVATAAEPASVPDISGPWQLSQGSATTLKTTDGQKPPLLPALQAAYNKNLAAFRSGDHSADPVSKCLPPGIPRLLMQPYPFNIVQGKTMYGFIFEWNHLNRVVYMNQDHFESIGPQYLGQAIGHWDGQTLVIDSNQFNDMTLLDEAGLPHTEALHTIERIRLIDGGKRLEDRIRIEDSGAFSKPWDAVLKFDKHPTAQINEDYCLGRTGHGTLSQK